MLAGERNRVEPIAARIEPRRVQGPHKSLHLLQNCMVYVNTLKLIFDSARTQVFDCACRNALRRGRGTTKQKIFVDQAAAI